MPCSVTILSRRAQTGTGKTAAFLLPILERTLDLPTGRIHALVLTPTRELAVQAEGFLRQLGRHTRLRGAAIYGGVGMRDQERALRGGAEIIVATSRTVARPHAARKR